VQITQVQKQEAMDPFRAGLVAAQHPIQPAAKLALSFFLHISAAIGGLNFTSL
jgi:hypothetical protein